MSVARSAICAGSGVAVPAAVAATAATAAATRAAIRTTNFLLFMVTPVRRGRNAERKRESAIFLAPRLQGALHLAARVAVLQVAALVALLLSARDASSTLTRPSRKYRRVGTRVRPFSRTVP